MSSKNLKSKKPPVLRLRWGAFILVVGFLSPLLIPLVLASGLSDGLKTLLSGALAFGIPELFMIIAVAIMGKEGFDYLKRYLRLVIRVYGPPETVSKTRYTIGLILFVIPLLFAVVAPYFITGQPIYLEYQLAITISLDILLISSLFVLGGAFWDKLRSLFIHASFASFTPKEKPK